MSASPRGVQPAGSSGHPSRSAPSALGAVLAQRRPGGPDDDPRGRTLPAVGA
ncbi:hypothetical protein [Actinomyces sp. oral taxon 414]|uniref:hypothetical protein n=1 Tax=Actinomyces sp. oral taxon 414 TaxID=712122 RepID=UPI0012ED29B5|nr:hypothetical protein [Actinomyces sp. oral taxon 414]